MFRPKKKIAHRFFLAILLVVVVPIGIMGYESHILAKKTLTAFAFQHMETIAEDRADHLSAWMEERLDDIGVLSRLPAIREMCGGIPRAGEAPSARFGKLLGETLGIIEGRSPSYENIFILGPEGNILAATHPEEAEAESRARGMEMLGRLQASTEPVLGSVYPNPEHGGWCLQVGSAVRSGSGEPLAFIMAVLDLSKTVDPILSDRTGLGASGETHLVDSHGRILSELRIENGEEPSGRTIEDYGVRSIMRRETGEAIYEGYTGREVVGAYVWLPRYGWGLLAEMETDEVMEPLQWLKAIGIFTTALVGGVCLFMAYAVSRRVSRPIVQAAQAAEKMAEGDLAQRIPFSSEDEVGGLARSFNAMAQRLALSVATLRRKEESLQRAYDDLLTAQEQLLRSERMAAIGELVASVAHEMRRPLSSIKLNLQIIGRSLGRDTALFEHYEIALEQAAHMERMFTELLNYSKPLELRKKDVSVEAAVGVCLRDLEGELSLREIRIDKAIPADLPPIIGDPDKIGQVLVNVLKNAMEASPRGGTIAISASADAEAPDGGGKVSITVSDQGQGVSQRHMHLMFQPFFTTKQSGAGLGLSVVKKIMDAHRGSVSITSVEGRGAVVRLTFPAIRGAE